MILLACTRCARECDSQTRYGGLCGACLVEERCEAMLADYARLWAKRRRYMAARAPVASVEAQLLRIVQRIQGVTHTAIPNPEHAREVLNAMLEKARNSTSRILVPA